LLLQELKRKDYAFLRFGDYLTNSLNHQPSPIILLRHDVDRRPENALAMAKLDPASLHFAEVKRLELLTIIKQCCNEKMEN
jgi:hypothetical protein